MLPLRKEFLPGKYLHVERRPKLMAASRATSAKLSTMDRNTKTQRARSRRVRRCHQGGLLRSGVCTRVAWGR